MTTEETYVDDEVQETIHETQVDATADEAAFAGLVDGGGSSVAVRLELPSGRTEDVEMPLPPAGEWEGSQIDRLLRYLGVTDAADLDAAIDQPVPLDIDDGDVRIDEGALAESDGRPSVGFELPTASEFQADILLFATGIGTAALLAAGTRSLAPALFPLVMTLVAILSLTPRIDGR